METNTIWYGTSKVSYDQGMQEYHTRHGVGSYEIMAGRWPHMEETLRRKEISSAIWVRHFMDMENGTWTTQVVQHIKRKLPPVLEINKPTNYKAVPKPTMISLLDGFQAVPQGAWPQPEPDFEAVMEEEE